MSLSSSSTESAASRRDGHARPEWAELTIDVVVFKDGVVSEIRHGLA